jgi:peptidoglycan/xylan/chitin deacetylase (PgdA/CDA1 family)
VLAYHAISDLHDDPVISKWSVPPALFAHHLDAIARGGWVFVDLGQVVRALDGEVELPAKSVLLTFDDAYVDLLSEAIPTMAKHGAPGVVFAVAGQIGGTNAWDSEKGARRLDLLDAGGLREAAEKGVEVGSHSTNHRPLRQVPPAQLEVELEGAANRLEATGLPRPRAFAYPHGDCDDRVAGAVAAAGYELAFTIRPGAVTPDADRFLLPRMEVLETDSPRDLRIKLATAAWPERLRLRTLRLLCVRR